MGLIRRFLSLIPLGLVLARQPFLMRPRGSGVNAIKLRPLDVAIAGSIHWAASSPMILRQPKYYTYVNETARWLLTPHEYATAQQSKRAMPNEKTVCARREPAARARPVSRTPGHVWIHTHEAVAAGLGRGSMHVGVGVHGM